ncbi:linear amide C-N hydrolase [Herbiconiux sp. KACC 21604]|uniref:linear amide C-N hydrolase n=1 Tax=unclassified Herbiconiux TaxID=2618217 RepID=UPI0014922AC0|nr:linear amide C-N hydrolase [Herbiconiux sp. SALV-R1]QJU55160.1 linear amide C-N hydrolase [Herbiconiux sp. SALV-R1]WPO86315.1 linear amide C-N hydrolase [Herbiconiux sp. KACC 21604]
MCTRILWNTNDVATTVARCMDWAVSDEPELWYLPPGLTRSGNADHESLTWTSQHGSVVTSMWGMGTVDGLNDKGLAAHALYLDPDDVAFPAADGRPSVANALWVQYLLDTYSTVADAIADIDRVRITSPLFRGIELGVHIALEDASGDSAIIEPLDGSLVVHHGREFAVMANSPTLDKQLENLARYRPFGGELPPPGDITSADRFVRSSYFLHYLPEPESVEEAVAGVFQLIANVSVPYGAPYSTGDVYPTWWRAGADLTNRIYYFGSTRSPNIFWITLDDLAVTPDVRKLDPRDPTRVGDQTSQLEPASLLY